ncbi:MAG TPA: hypothetical protein VK543_16955 [Puia sp.]|nr:hypothetical protein [Puia sp.]
MRKTSRFGNLRNRIFRFGIPDNKNANAIARRGNSIAKAGVIVNGSLAFFTLVLLLFALGQWIQARRANDALEAKFRADNRDAPYFDKSVVYAHAYRNLPDQHNLVQVHFDLYNASENIIDVEYIKYKVCFDCPLKPELYKKGIPKEILTKMDSTIYFKYLRNVSESYVEVRVDLHLSTADSLKLSQNKNVVFAETHYTNRRTGEKFIYQKIGTISGYDLREESIKTVHEPVEEWVNKYYNVTDIPVK